MNDSKAKQDGIGTIHSLESSLYHGLAQGWTPLIKHQRTCYVWHEYYKGFFRIASVNTETLIVRPRFN